MGKNDKKFVVGDLVFAKVKGYPAWPAKITNISQKKKYHVYFYGTGETATIKHEDIFHYSTQKDKYSAEKFLRRPNFREAMEQIEAASKGNDAAPLEDLAEINARVNAAAFKPDISVLESDQSILNDNTDSINITPENAKRNEPAVKKFKPEPIPSDNSSKKENITDQSTDQESVTSRSGRKIKPKRYLIDETLEAVSPVAKKRMLGESTPNTKVAKTGDSGKTAIDESNTTVDKNEQYRLDKHKNLLLAILPNGQCVGIKVDHAKPATFDSDPARKSWHFDAAKKALDMKTGLESGQIKITDDIKLMLDLDPDISKEHIRKLKDAKTRASTYNILKLEHKLLDLDTRIKKSCSLKVPDPAQCVQLLDEYKELEITPLMLKKNPDCVQTLKRLRAYVGNAAHWSISEEELLRFRQHASDIRTKANQIYNNFKKIFNYPSDRNFYESFLDDVQKFNKETSHLSSIEIMKLTKDITLNSSTDDKQSDISTTI